MTLISGLLTPVIAVVAVWIAFQQWRVQNIKLRLDLFDRRIKVFDALTALLGTILRDAKTTRQQLAEFAAGTANADFLFGSEIADYLRQVRSKAVEQMQLTERLTAHAFDPNFAERSELTHKESELLTWLANQLEDARPLFEPYLGFADAQRSRKRLRR